jgi:hypothetical protein
MLDFRECGRDCAYIMKIELNNRLLTKKRYCYEVEMVEMF